MVLILLRQIAKGGAERVAFDQSWETDCCVQQTQLYTKAAGVKEAGKAFAYYGKNTKSFYSPFMKGIKTDLLTSIGTTVVSSDYMKTISTHIVKGLL